MSSFKMTLTERYRKFEDIFPTILDIREILSVWAEGAFGRKRDRLRRNDLHVLEIRQIGRDYVLADYYREGNNMALMTGNFPRNVFSRNLEEGDKYEWMPVVDGSMEREDFERIVG